MLQVNIFSQSPFPIVHANRSRSRYCPRTKIIIRRRRRRRSIPPLRRAVEKEGEFEVEFDPKKSCEALQRLDWQMQSPSEQDTLPKARPPSPYQELNLDRDSVTGMRTDEMPDIPGSYLAYSAVALLILTIFNNIMFDVFVKPSVNGPEQSAKIERVPLSESKYNKNT